MMRWIKWSVRAKSGMSLEREMKKSNDMTLQQISNQFPIHKQPLRFQLKGGKRTTHPIKLFNSQTNPNIHPTVVSPLKLLQLNTRSKEKCFPATSAVNRIKAVATAYHITCRSTIWERIFRGGSSVSAPGRGGRRRRAICA